VAGKKRKSLSQQFFEAQERKAKEKAAQEKAEREAAQKAKKAAEREQMLTARQAQRAAETLAKQQQAADAKQVQQVLREMEKRETLRQQQEVQEARDKKRAEERAAVEAKRTAKAETLQEFRDEAAERTRKVEATIEAIGSILSGRDRDLEELREETDTAFADGEAGVYAARVSDLLAERAFLNRGRPVQVVYAPDTRRLTLAVDLPRKERVPTDKAFRYIAARGEIVAEPRKPAEIQRIYQDAIARLTLCVADYAAAMTSAALVESIAVNGHVRTTDPATGQPVNPCLVTFLASREDFEQVSLDEPRLDPVRCLHHLKALVSPNPFDLEPVTPIVNFDLERYKLVEEAGALAGLDSRLDLLALSPYEFEQLIQNLFVAMGYNAWKTQNSRDDGVDAVAVRDDIAIGGVAVIQAKRYTKTVPIEAVRALFGTMQEKKAYTGLVITTSSFGPASYDFAKEVGRITLIEGRQLKALLKEHLGMDVLISLAKLPRGWTLADAGLGAGANAGAATNTGVGAGAGAGASAGGAAGAAGADADD
jgi:restriction system protein